MWVSCGDIDPASLSVVVSRKRLPQSVDVVVVPVFAGVYVYICVLTSSLSLSLLSLPFHAVVVPCHETLQVLSCLVIIGCYRCLSSAGCAD